MYLKIRRSSEFFNDQNVLDNAVFAKNCMIDQNGYSPYHLVFGKSPRLPGNTQNRLPGLEEVCESQSVLLARHLSTLSQAKMGFLQADCSRSIGKALLHNTRADDGPYYVGNNVYYKRVENRWRGPARVIGHDGRVIVVPHRGQIIRVHSHCLRKTRDRQPTDVNTETNSSMPEEKRTVNPKCHPVKTAEPLQYLEDD